MNEDTIENFARLSKLVSTLDDRLSRLEQRSNDSTDGEIEGAVGRPSHSSKASNLRDRVNEALKIISAAEAAYRKSQSHDCPNDESPDELAAKPDVNDDVRHTGINQLLKDIVQEHVQLAERLNQRWL